MLLSFGQLFMMEELIFSGSAWWRAGSTEVRSPLDFLCDMQ